MTPGVAVMMWTVRMFMGWRTSKRFHEAVRTSFIVSRARLRADAGSFRNALDAIRSQNSKMLCHVVVEGLLTTDYYVIYRGSFENIFKNMLTSIPI